MTPTAVPEVTVYPAWDKIRSDATRFVRRLRSFDTAVNEPDTIRTPTDAHVIAKQEALVIAGEFFLIEHEEGSIYLRHPHWSLVGVGHDLLSAREDLLQEAAELMEVLRTMPLDTFGRDLLALREYLFDLF